MKTYGMSASAIASTSINRSCVMRKLQEVEGLGGFGRSEDRKAFISTKNAIEVRIAAVYICLGAVYKSCIKSGERKTAKALKE